MKILKLGIFLALVAALSGGALSYVNGITAPIIEANELATEKATLLSMYPEAKEDDFVSVDISNIDSSTITKVYSYGDYYIFNMSVSGYKDGTTFLVSIDKNTNVIDKYVALSNGDTKGLGSKVTEDAFKESMEGKDASGQLDTISGATISSSAVVNGINEAASVMKDLK